MGPYPGWTLSDLCSRPSRPSTSRLPSLSGSRHIGVRPVRTGAVSGSERTRPLPAVRTGDWSHDAHPRLSARVHATDPLDTGDPHRVKSYLPHCHTRGVRIGCRTLPIPAREVKKAGERSSAMHTVTVAPPRVVRGAYLTGLRIFHMVRGILVSLRGSIMMAWEDVAARLRPPPISRSYIKWIHEGKVFICDHRDAAGAPSLRSFMR